MATLRYFPPSGAPLVVTVSKPLMTIGRATDNDLVIADKQVAPHHLKIIFNGRDFQYEEFDRDVPLEVNGKKKRRGRLVDGDRLSLGDTATVAFSMFSLPQRVAPRLDSETNVAVTQFGDTKLQKLFEFSQRLMGTDSLEALLQALLEGAMEVTGASRGAVLLRDLGESVEESNFEVRVAKNLNRSAIAKDGEEVSDSIVRHVLDTGRPLIVSDAVSDTVFGSSESVIALQLSSVMCTPIIQEGVVVGALYVGNDQVKSLFTKLQLETLVVFASQASLLIRNSVLLSALREDNKKLEAELQGKKLGDIIGSCASMLEVFRKVQKVAPTDISVLVTGETGTGKELIAREIHRRSDRESGPFVTINCGAIPENLIESELFGHVKGAFTGGVASRPGKFQVANGGTLFLDEVGELPLNLQVKLLRALQERMVTRVGDSKPEKCDIRVVSATNRNLLKMSEEGSFREDLFYRLNVINIELPPLRERADDILIIAKALLSKYASEMNSSVRGFAPNALIAIRKFAWPGNVRQLENRIKKALVLCDGNLIGAADLDLEEAEQDLLIPLEQAKEEFQRGYILKALERNNGNRTQAARELGVDPRTIFRYLERESNSES